MIEFIFPDDAIFAIGRLVLALSNLDHALLLLADTYTTDRDESVRQIYFKLPDEKVQWFIDHNRHDPVRVAMLQNLFPPLNEARGILQSQWNMTGDQLYMAGYSAGPSQGNAAKEYRVAMSAARILEVAEALDRAAQMMAANLQRSRQTRLS